MCISALYSLLLGDYAVAVTCSAYGSGRDSFSGIRAWFENRARRQSVFKITFGFHDLIKMNFENLPV